MKQHEPSAESAKFPYVSQKDCERCHARIGFEHKRTCEAVTKLVKVKLAYDVNVVVPHFWTEADVVFWLNDSSWCADNGLDLIELQSAEHRDNCTCNVFKGEVIETVDATPTLRRSDAAPRRDGPDAVDAYRAIAAMDDDEREAFWHKLHERWCRHCGRQDCHGVCENDE
jgi:hypothetical protein